jgi:type I restriction enzyme M protein
MPAKRKAASPKDSTANLGFEAKLRLAADKLRNNMDAATMQVTHPGYK